MLRSIFTVTSLMLCLILSFIPHKMNVRVCVHVCVSVCACVCVPVQGFQPPVAKRLSDWSFIVPNVDIKLNEVMTREQQLAALPTIVDQLRNLDAPGAYVKFRYKEGCEGLADAVREARATLGHLRVEHDTYASDDEETGELRTHTHTHTHWGV